MTKRKKGLILACASFCALSAGAGLCVPKNYHAYAAEVSKSAGITALADEESSWKEVPRISGWSWGAFNAEKNRFSAVPAEGYNGDVVFTFTNAESQTILTVTEKVLDGAHAFYFTEDSQRLDDDAAVEAYFSQTLGRWDAGDYTMTAFADSQGGNRHNSSVSFSVVQAKNYWTVSPYIESWYKGEWTEAKDFYAPVSQSAYGDLVEYKIYGATEEGEIDYAALYYTGTSNPDETPNVGKLRGAEEGRYFLTAHVAGTKNYAELNAVVPFRIFDSQATKAALDEAKENAYADINRFAADLNVNIDLKEVRDAMYNVDLATTVSGVSRALSGTRLVIYKIYAKNAIVQYAEKLRETYELVLDVTLDAPMLAEEVRSINDAPDIATVEKNLTVALGKIYDEGVKEERGKAAAELAEYAGKFGIEAYADFTGAKTFEEVWELLALEQHKVDDRVFEEVEIADLNEYKQRVKEAILHYATYIGIDLGEPEDKFHLQEIDQKQTHEEVDEFYAQTKTNIDAELITFKAKLLLDLQKFARSYSEKYPLATELISEIISFENPFNGVAGAEMNNKEKTPTVIWANSVYEKYCSQIKELLLPYAKDKVKEELVRLAEDANIPEFDAELARFLQAVDDAETVDEVEEVLAAATFQIGNTLYTARMEMIQEFDAFAAEYFAEYNWSALMGALDEGKQKIYGAKSVAEIYEAGTAAKVLFTRVYLMAELDYYAELYADFDILHVIDTQRELGKLSTTVKGLLGIRDKALENIFNAAKTTAPESLQSQSAHYANFDYAGEVKKIKEAEKLEDLYAAYLSATARLNALKEQVQRARDMLELYAESYGLSVTSEPVLLALDKIYAAASPEEVSELMKAAKADIDAAAGKAQKHVDSVNAGLIACTVIFAVAAVGLATLLVLIWRKKKVPEKKSTKPAAEAKESAPQKNEETAEKKEEVAVPVPEQKTEEAEKQENPQENGQNAE